MRFLVTAGPTREMIDAVRFLSNLSSGRTGWAVAAAARSRGHEVTLVHGPVHLSPLQGITTVPVTSALEMHREVLGRLGETDVLIMTAAVADYRPKRVVDGKLKKGPGPMTLELVRNPDILMDAGRDKGRRVHVGFALEVQDAEENARRKLRDKNLDALVLNGPENLGSDRSRFRLLLPGGEAPGGDVPKDGLGEALVTLAERLAAARGDGGA